MDCLSTCCLNHKHRNIETLFNKENSETEIITLDSKKDGIHYRLEYAPLGNRIFDPIIILCGITPGYDSWQMFRNAIYNGLSKERAAFISIFSNMRIKMYRCLKEIGLFEYLSLIHGYWNTDSYEKSWNEIFTNESASKNCGLQLTQACNCAILRNTDSKQPSESALNEINRKEPTCLFNRVSIGPSTRLIIFWGLGRRLNIRWTKSCYYNESIKTVLLPHPSGNNIVYNNYDLFKPYNNNDSTQLRNAKTSIKEAKEVIIELINELN